ncbi:ABC transporter ATP-binding protein [Runella aurantiaca]|uniref:ATP-binding cassette domain-containing protein n=1 Tax=Runella aurantiaca TaxID=2282308 RepID=A0A369IAV1_9BACT|nr:ABC transporter ATP-binding protein [Runella aurantiaca]RDB04344.1 ATP-binding cassette domain-containing protein [Runella aurantiaca]
MKPIIKVENLSKQYRLGTIGTGTLSNDLKRWWHQVRGKEDPFLTVGESNDRTSKGSSEYVWALKDINFEVMPGEILGIIGKNGAGKSTLLKILSKVTGPTTGRILYDGRIGSLLEVGTGFHPELTGRENIYLNGAILGMTRQEIRAKLDEIIDFSGCERYIDTPVKRYSSGMTVRLGFAVAAHLEPEILVVDEVLAVGDAEFQKKAIGKMQDVSRNHGRTVLFVSHNMNSLTNLCTKGIVLMKGISPFQSKINDAIQFYLQNDYVNRGDYNLNETPKEKEAYFTKIRVVDENGVAKNDFFYTEKICISYQIHIAKKNAKYKLFCVILDYHLRPIFSCESIGIKEDMLLKIPEKFLVRGDYSIHTFIHVPRVEQVDIVENMCQFRVIDNGSPFQIHGDYNYGSVFSESEWV